MSLKPGVFETNKRLRNSFELPVPPGAPGAPGTGWNRVEQGGTVGY